jgi:GTP-binding protein
VQFIDESEIHVKAGDGGPGAVAFRREKFVPRGGPSGGDGGDGGDIVLEADLRLTTLLDFRFKREHTARNGEPGRGRDQNGHAALDLVLRVPPGTIVKSVETGEVLRDLRDPGDRWVLAAGGRGGLGNMNFATPTLQAPRFAQPGTEGEEKWVRLELRLLADVGLVGFPNAGKSTLVARLSRARPKIADYPFTTLQPHLGVVQYKDGRSFVLSDLPGLIEGAHAGAGLGTRFLKHMQRCRAIVHLLDASAAPLQGRDLVADYEAINRELALFDPALGRKAQVVAANKIDLPEAREAAAAFAKVLAKRGVPVHLISGATGEGIPGLLDAAVRLLDTAGPAEPLLRDLPQQAEAGDTDGQALHPEASGVGVEAGEQAGAKAGAEAGERADAGAEEEFAPLVDERAEAARAKQERAPKLTGRRKDGMFKEKAAQAAQPLGQKFQPTSEAAALLLSAAARRQGGKQVIPPVRKAREPKVKVAQAKAAGPAKKAAASKKPTQAGGKKRTSAGPKGSASKAAKSAVRKLGRTLGNKPGKSLGKALGKPLGSKSPRKKDSRA